MIKRFVIYVIYDESLKG